MRKEKLDEVTDGAFKACCGIFFLKTSVSIKPRTVNYRAYDHMQIINPEWCPLLPENKDKPKVYDITSAFDNAAEKRRKEEEARKAAELEKKAAAELEKKKMKEKLPRRVEWESINVGDNYVIPRIESKPCKFMKVVDKNVALIKLKEIEQDGSLSIMVSTIFKDDIEAKLMTALKKF